MITVLVVFALAAGSTASVDCSAIVEARSSWPASNTGVFTMNVPPGYEYQRLEVTSGSAGKWVQRSEKGQSAINFTVGSLGKFQREYVRSTCTQTIHGRETRIQTGIGSSGRYFVRAEWLKPVAADNRSFLVVWADTADPADQLQALAAVRTVEIGSK